MALNTLSSAVSLVVVSGLLLIINNTIEGGVQSRREEIRTKQLEVQMLIPPPVSVFRRLSRAAGGTLACLLTAELGHQLGTEVKALALLYQTDFALAGLSFGQNLVVILLGAGIGWLAAFFSVSRKIATFSY